MPMAISAGSCSGEFLLRSANKHGEVAGRREPRRPSPGRPKVARRPARARRDPFHFHEVVGVISIQVLPGRREWQRLVITAAIGGGRGGGQAVMRASPATAQFRHRLTIARPQKQRRGSRPRGSGRWLLVESARGKMAARGFPRFPKTDGINESARTSGGASWSGGISALFQ